MTGKPLQADDSNAAFENSFHTANTLAIFRGYDPGRTVELANRAWDAGIGAVEVPLSTDTTSLVSLQAAVKAGAERGRLVGAGSIVSQALVEAAAAGGAAFTVAPGWDGKIAEASLAHGLPHLPGVMTPSDVTAAVTAGLKWLKLFPASLLGPSAITALLGPFPDVRFVATGGVAALDAQEYLRAGAQAVALGSMFAADLSDDSLRQLIEQCRVTRKVHLP